MIGIKPKKLDPFTQGAIMALWVISTVAFSYVGIFVLLDVWMSNDLLPVTQWVITIVFAAVIVSSLAAFWLCV